MMKQDTCLPGGSMSANWICGFRRIGLVISFPITALIVLTWYDQITEYSPSNYQPELMDDREIKETSINTQIIGMGNDRAYFNQDVPKNVAQKVAGDFLAKHTSKDKNDLLMQKFDKAGLHPPPLPGEPINLNWVFTIGKRVNYLKFAVLILGSLGCVTLTIQGCISVAAWAIEGFRR